MVDIESDTEFATLMRQAEAKLGELKDDVTRADAERIEREHDEILRKLEARKKLLREYAEIERMAPSYDAAALVKRMIGDNAEPQTIRNAILDQLVDRQNRQGGPSGGSHSVGYSRMTNTNTFDNPQFTNDAAANAIFSKLSRTEPPEHARSLMGLSLSQMGERMGGDRNWLDSTRSGGGMLTTSDFSVALGSAVGRRLLDMMRAAESGASQIVEYGVVEDFRPVQSVRMSSFPSLEKVNEHGEIVHGALDDTGETMRVESFARLINISYQALRNDDLGAINAAIRNVAFAANELKAKTIISALSATMSDGQPLFHSTHNNFAASGTALGVEALSSARIAMRQQKALDSTTPLGLTPKILLIPTALETVAEQLVASITPAQSSDVNPFANKLTVAVEPRLTDATAFFLFADAALYPTIKFATLSGFEAPRLESNDEWDRLGTSWRVIWHVGAAPIDYRGAYKDPGAAVEE
jgi:hypothetical protein